MDALHWWRQGDVVTQGTALLLLAMSVASWVVIFWKARLMHRASADVARCTAAFWQAPSLDVAAQRLQSFDREALVLPLVVAANSIANPVGAGVQATLATSGSLSQQITRVLRDALHGVLGRLQWGQVLLATVGSTAPFVGLLGTVWGIYHALSAMAGAGQITIDRVAGPVGEALVMTAAGHSGGAGLQRVRPLHWPHRGRPGRFCARPARVAGAAPGVLTWHLAASNAPTARNP